MVPAAPTNDWPQGLRVASYNIHKGVLGMGPAKRLRIHALQEGLRGLGADVVLLQEVQFEHRRNAQRFASWPVLPQHELLGQGLGMFAAYHTNAHTRHGEHGNALLSRFPILGISHQDVSDHRFEQRGLLHARLAVPRDALAGAPARVLHCVVVHFGLFRSGRRRQIQRLAEYLAHQVPDDEPVIVGGDFNDWRGELGAELGALGLLDVSTRAAPRVDARHPRWHQRMRTFPALLPLMPLDRIYVRGFAAHGVALGWGADWARLSDHAPLLVDLTPLPSTAYAERPGSVAHGAAATRRRDMTVAGGTGH